MEVPPLILLKGLWYALEQCGFLLRDATILQKSKSYPSAVALALLAREELGRHRILLDLWSKVDKDGRNPSVEDIRKACDDHVEKQRQAQLSLSYLSSGTRGLAAVVRSLMTQNPQSPEYLKARETLDRINEIKAKRTPGDRHSTRMRALYVDIKDSGTEWNRPSEMSPAEATNSLVDAANDYAGQFHRLTSGFLSSQEPKLASALDVWPERPELPVPSWPEVPM